MAANKPGMSMFGVGAAIGLVFSAALAILLSVANPLPPGGILASEEAPVTTAAAPPAPEPLAPAPDDPVNAVDDPADGPADDLADDPTEVAETSEEAPAATDTSAANPAPSETEATPGPEPVETAEFVDDGEAVAPAPAIAPVEPRGVVETEAPSALPTDDTATPVAAPAEEPQPTPAPAPAEEAAETPAPPPLITDALQNNSERFEGDPSLPMLAIVLDGLGDATDDADDIFLLPAPLAIVVSTDGPASADLVEGARDAGFEALVALEAGALAEAATLLDGAGAVIGAAATGEIGDADAVGALTALLSARGMGLLDLTADGGSTSFRVAQTEGVPSAAGGRRFDTAPSSAAVYQALERAAFDARRLGAFVAVGRPSEAVLTGLRRWMNVKAGKSVNLAPLSAVLTKTGG